MELCSLDIRELSWAWQHSWDSEDEDSEAEAGGDNTGDSGAEAGEDTVQPATDEEEVMVESLRPASAEEAAAGHTEDSSGPASAGAQEVNTASGGSDEAEEVKIEVTLEVPVEVKVEVRVEDTTEVPVEVPARLLCAEILLDLVEDTFYICPPLPGHGGQEVCLEPGHGGQELGARSQEPGRGGQEVCEVILQEAVTSAVALVEVRSKGGNDISL